MLSCGATPGRGVSEVLHLVFDRDQVPLLESELVSPPPERLVHLVGRQMLPGTYRVHALVHDEHAQAGATHCRPSADAELAIRETEAASGGWYIGILHSHPVGFPEPSGQDEQAAWDSLALNPHLEAFFVGVTTSTRHGALPEHRTAIGAGQLSVHAAHRPSGQFEAVRCTVGTADFLDMLAARMPRETVASLGPRKVAVFGAGSLGSTIAETMVRNGVSAFHLVDPDRVEAVNLSRSIYTTADIGCLKVDALADRLHQVNPLAVTRTLSSAVDDGTASDGAAICAWADLVIAVTDDPRAQVILDVLAHEADTPAVFAGVMPGGHSGEIVITLPGLTTCYRCSAGNLRLNAFRGDMDYDSGRIKGAVALGADVAVVAAAAAKTALSLLGLLHGSDDNLWKPVLEGRNMVHIGLAPQALGHVEVLDQLPHQHLFQSVWMLTEPSEDCDHCRPQHNRTAPGTAADIQGDGALPQRG